MTPEERETAFKALQGELQYLRDAAAMDLEAKRRLTAEVMSLDSALNEERAARAKIQAENERLSLELGMAQSRAGRAESTLAAVTESLDEFKPPHTGEPDGEYRLGAWPFEGEWDLSKWFCRRMWFLLKGAKP